MLRSLRIHAILLLAGTLTACAGEEDMTSGVTVKMDPAQFQAAQSDVPKRARVEVVDVRQEIRNERTAAFNTSMGHVSFEPPETDLVKAMLESRVNAVLAKSGTSATPPVIYSGIRAFDVETPATALYWDVRIRVELVLRVNQVDRVVSGEGTERTYAWPSAEVIKKATNQALLQVGSESEAALSELLAAPSH